MLHVKNEKYSRIIPSEVDYIKKKKKKPFNQFYALLMEQQPNN